MHDRLASWDPGAVPRSLAVLLGLLLVLVGCDSGGGDPQSGRSARVSVRFPIPIVENGQTTFYVADDRGYYNAEGLDVEFAMGSRELNPVKTVATGQDMFGILGGPDTLLVARARGQPLKAIAVIHRDSNFPCLLTLRSSGVTQLDQLQDSKIGFFYGHISTDVLRNLLRKNDIRNTEYDVGFDYNQLISGSVDAQWAFTVTAGLDLPHKGVEVNTISPADYGISTHGYTIFATEKLIETQPDVVLRFLRASLRGVVDTLDDPVAATGTLLSRESTLDRDLALKRQEAYNAVTSNSDDYPAGYMDRAMFQETYDRLVEEGVIKQSFDVGEAYTTRFLEEIHGRPFSG